MCRLSGRIEPFEQLIENGIGTGEIEHLFGRGDYVQFRERSLHLCVANNALPGQKRAHSSELKMERNHVCRERPDGANQIGDDFTLIRAECHERPRSNRGATDRLCSLSTLPLIPTRVSEAFRRDGWIYEEKVDGWRILAYKDGPKVRLIQPGRPRCGLQLETDPVPPGPSGRAHDE
jgi:hypothetical protein